MKRVLVFAAGSAALLMSCVSAFAIESEYKATSTHSVADVWAKVGNFCGIGNWHPAVAKCELSYGNKIRTLTLKGGGTIVERLMDWDKTGHSYTYRIVKSPLPIKNYISTIKVVADGSGSDIIWSGKYKAVKGTTDDAAKKIIDGIYKDGADALAK